MKKNKSETLGVEDLRKEFIKTEDFEQLARERQQLAEELTVLNKKLQSRVEELEAQLSYPTLLGSITPEEIICIQQIKLLEKISKDREMTLDEAKKMEIFVKNLRLIKNQPTENLNAPYRDVTEAELVAIATKKDD